MSKKNSEAVAVVVRCRPFSRREIAQDCKHIISMKPDIGQVSIANPDKENAKKPFTFDAVYDETATQRGFYEESCFGLVESVLEGFNGTIFAYGQTGCGKTHTMQGLDNPPEMRGVIPNSFDHIFETIDLTQENGIDYLLRCTYLEIYNEEIRDLLSKDGKNKCDLKEDPQKGVYCKGLTNVVVNDKQVFFNVMDSGQANRTVGATLMNEGSSRSHAIFTIFIEMSQKDEKGQDHFKMGKLNLVDLAGSERATKTGATGDRLKEGAKINLSLSALGNVISALVDGKGKHIPYRDSKLTRLLQDSLGGNTKTLMVAAISPADYNFDETMSTLRYANRAKNIKNKPTINEDPKDTLLREYKMEIDRLKKLLEAKETMQNFAHEVGMEKAGTRPQLMGVVESAQSMSPRAAVQTQDATGLPEEKAVPASSEDGSSSKASPDRSRSPVEEDGDDELSPASPVKVHRTDSLPPQDLQTVDEEQSAHFSTKSALMKIPSKPALNGSESATSLAAVSEAPSNADIPDSDTTLDGGMRDSESTIHTEERNQPRIKSNLSTISDGNEVNQPRIESNLSTISDGNEVHLNVEDVMAASPAQLETQKDNSTGSAPASPLDFMGPQATLMGSDQAGQTSLPPSSRKASNGAVKSARRPSDGGGKAHSPKAEILEASSCSVKEATSPTPTLTPSGSKPYLQPKPQKEIVVEYKDRIVEKVVEVEKVVKEVVEVEKIPQKHIETQAALEEYTKSIADQRNKLGNELQMAQEIARKQRQEREQLAAKLLQMEHKLQSAFMGHSSNNIGGTSPKKETPESVLARERAEHRRAQLKAKMKKKKEAQKAAEKKKAQEEKEEMEMVLLKAVEDKEENERRMNHLKKRLENKVNQARQEIQDLTEEFEAERENMTDMLRDANKEVELWRQVAAMFLSSREMRKVSERSVWVEEVEEWRIPALKSTRPPRAGIQAHLPKLPNHSDTDASDSNRSRIQGGVRVGRMAGVSIKGERRSQSPNRSRIKEHKERSLSPGGSIEGSAEYANEKKSGRTSKESTEEREKRRRLRRQRKEKKRQKEAAALAAQQQGQDSGRNRSSTSEVLAEMARTMRGQSGSGSRKHNKITIRKYEEESWATDYRSVLNDVEEFRNYKETEDEKKELLGIRTGSSAPTSDHKGAGNNRNWMGSQADKGSTSEKNIFKKKSGQRRASSKMKFAVMSNTEEEDDPYAMIETNMPSGGWGGVDADGNKLPTTDRSHGEEATNLWGQQQPGRLPSRREGRTARSQQEGHMKKSSSKSSNKKGDEGELSQSVSVKVEGANENSVNISFNVHIDHKPTKPSKEGRSRKHRSSRTSGRGGSKNEGENSSARNQSSLEGKHQGNADAGAGNSNYTQMLEMFWNGEDGGSNNTSRRTTEPTSNPYDMLERDKF